MDNNDIIRNLRYIFDFSDSTMNEIFGYANLSVTRAELSEWLKKEDDTEFTAMNDRQLASFLNGLIIYKRGRKDGELPIPEKRLNNNIVFKKLKIALNLKNEEVLEILESVERKISKHELSAFFRNPEQNQYRDCKDQILRNFLHGLKLRFRNK